MPVWVEVILAWVVIGTVLNVAAHLVFRKRGYFKWLNNMYDSEAYRRGYDDAKTVYKINQLPVYKIDPESMLRPPLNRYEIKDNRYN